MVQKRVRKSLPRVAKLFREALADADLTSADFGRVTGWGRTADALVRGEVLRISPEQARESARWLPITQEQILAAYGFDIAMTPERQLPRSLADAWVKLPLKTRAGMLELIELAASQIAPADERAAS
jgi:hypothetical protein